MMEALIILLIVLLTITAITLYKGLKQVERARGYKERASYWRDNYIKSNQARQDKDKEIEKLSRRVINAEDELAEIIENSSVANNKKLAKINSLKREVKEVEEARRYLFSKVEELEHKILKYGLKEWDEKGKEIK
tara:strand:+ start:290 stop:694 length:405 start_codon:yes stop_codon:yes gene_type:complete